MSKETENKEPWGVFIYIIFTVLVFIVVWLFINDASRSIAWFGKHLTNLLNGAGLDPRHPKEFAKFIQLFLFAVFFGWAASRFKRK